MTEYTVSAYDLHDDLTFKDWASFSYFVRMYRLHGGKTLKVTIKS